MKLTDSKRVLMAVTMEVGARDPVGCCDSKTARKSALFSCPGLAGGNELALVIRVERLETALLGVDRLA